MKIGLTGGLASGKSTVAQRWSELGLVVVDADEIVAALYRPGMAGTDAVRELFGDNFLLADGAVNHVRLAGHVFADREALTKLEERIHPLVLEEFKRRAAAAQNPIVIEGTLLVEAGYAPELDLLVTVEADRGKRLEWAVARGMSKEQAGARLAAQGDGELRRRAAHRIISNDGTLAELLGKADRLAAEILELEAVEAP